MILSNRWDGGGEREREGGRDITTYFKISIMEYA